MFNITEPVEVVKRASLFIWLSFSTNVISYILLLFLPIPKSISATLESTGWSLQHYVFFTLSAYVVVAIIIYFILRNLKLGKNWARIFCLVYGIVVLPMTILRVSNNIHEPIVGIISLVVNTFYLGFGYYALYMIFTFPGKTWFDKIKSTASTI